MEVEVNFFKPLQRLEGAFLEQFKTLKDLDFSDYHLNLTNNRTDSSSTCSKCVTSAEARDGSEQ